MDVQKRKMLNVWLWPKNKKISVKYLNIRHILRHCDDVIASGDVEHRGKYQPLAKVSSCTLPMNIYNIYHSLLLTLYQSIEPVRFWPIFRQSVTKYLCKNTRTIKKCCKYIVLPMATRTGGLEAVCCFRNIDWAGGTSSG